MGRIGKQAYFLVESKAHIEKIISSCQAKSPSSKALIKKSLDEIRKYLGLKPDIDLTQGFYQYANRLAHLYLLRVLNATPAYLVFVYFINDSTHIVIYNICPSDLLLISGRNNETRLKQGFKEYNMAN